MATGCARARRRPARARCGLRVSPASPGLSLRPVAARWFGRLEVRVALGGGVTVRYAAATEARLEPCVSPHKLSARSRRGDRALPVGAVRLPPARRAQLFARHIVTLSRERTSGGAGGLRLASSR